MWRTLWCRIPGSIVLLFRLLLCNDSSTGGAQEQKNKSPLSFLVRAKQFESMLFERLKNKKITAEFFSLYETIQINAPFKPKKNTNTKMIF